MDCSSGIGRVTGQQCPSFLQRVLLPCHPQGQWLVPAALNKPQLCLEMGWQQGL